MARTKLTILLIIFILLSLISIFSVYYTHQLPTELKTTDTLCFYRHTGTYDYTAKLKPNLLYNQPTLKSGQGTLYTKIIDHINVTFTYTFTCSHPTNTSIEYYINTELESPAWGDNKRFTAAEMLETFQIANTVNLTQHTASTTIFLNTTQVNEIVKTVDGQIGTSTSQYNLLVKPEIYIVAKINITQADVRTIYESFAHNLTIEFRKGTPNYISIDSLEQTRPDTIDQTQTTSLPWVTNQRNASYAFCAVAFPALVITALMYIKTKPKIPPKLEEKAIRKIFKKYKEIIVETIEAPPSKPDMTTIKVANMEDLAKISEALIEPILYIQKTPTAPNKETTHIFYITHNNTKYQYETPPSKPKPKKTKEG